MINKINTYEAVYHEKITSITCDICGKEYSKEKDIYECQEFIHIYENCGYGSIFGDGDSIELDICQHCFKKLFEGKYRIISE